MRWALLIILMAIVPQAFGQHFSLPLNSLKLTSPFGPRWHPVLGRPDFHKGIDLSARTEPVLAVLPGTVVSTGFDGILGNYVRISHGQMESIYGHLRLVCVNQADTVAAGQMLGITGSTGRSTGEHLHFAIKFQDRFIDPLEFLLAIQRQGEP